MKKHYIAAGSLLLAFSGQVFAQSVLGRSVEEVRREQEQRPRINYAICPKVENRYVEVTSPVDYDYLSRMGVELLSENYEVRHLSSIIRDMKKFPQGLMEEMVENGAKIHLINGRSVVDDPSWNTVAGTTFDGRDWSTIPGTGGFPHFGVPTRIVVNRLYEGHSFNLFLHEHGHTLDSTYEDHGLSRSAEWQSISSSTKGKDIIDLICRDYCVGRPEEAFAEMFAYYYSCQETKEFLEVKAPEMASYFKNLKRIREKEPEVGNGKEDSGPESDRRIRFRIDLSGLMDEL